MSGVFIKLLESRDGFFSLKRHTLHLFRALFFLFISEFGGEFLGFRRFFRGVDRETTTTNATLKATEIFSPPQWFLVAPHAARRRRPSPPAARRPTHYKLWLSKKRKKESGATSTRDNPSVAPLRRREQSFSGQGISQRGLWGASERYFFSEIWKIF